MDDIYIMSREGWNAKSSIGNYGKNKPKYIILHHSLNPSSSSYGTYVIRNIQAYHMSSKGFNDIGYHYLISVKGVIYKGRPDTANGAHTKGKNSKSIGICIIGNFDEEDISDDAYVSLISLLCKLCKEHNILVENIKGHCDYARKTCPGKNLYSKLSDIQKDILLKLS